jgi:hypothetical protein
VNGRVAVRNGGVGQRMPEEVMKMFDNKHKHVCMGGGVGMGGGRLEGK